MAGRRLAGALVTVVVAVLLSSVLIRLAPGFGLDERQLDLRLSEQSVRALRQESSRRDSGGLDGCLHYLTGLFRGDWGVSISLRRPVRELVSERAPLTLRTLGIGGLAAWAGSFSVSFALLWVRRRELEHLVTAGSGLLLCLPAAAVASLFLYAGRGPAAALAVVLFPKLLQYTRKIVNASHASPHVLAAAARGAGRGALIFRHVCWPALPELLATIGVSVSMAIGAVIPVEALCDSPGVGQLLWQAAMARDLPVLLHMTLLVTAITSIANLSADAMRLWIAAEA